MDLVQPLNAPCLQSLTLGDHCSTNDAKRISSCYPGLRQLRLVGLTAGAGLVGLLTPLTSLETLIIPGSVASNASLRPLIIPDAGFHCTDTIKMLVIEQPSCFWTPSKMFLSMVRRHLKEAIFPPLVFNIWTDGHKYYSKGSSSQLSVNHGVLLELAKTYLERVQITDWEPFFWDACGNARSSMMRRKTKFAAE
ncbi:hypothetical protein M422DRAFT_274318 [Sphaerobolus stellatus SS14]|uniref:Uncharacterized protein n=1 Tax=Sphaerobolus stellatus (strain SS14) TaxID=990650 RepID=A0A0C9TSJ1_SPHS4|nr:hypothetical protein M422DRAFT_274318 [Sphaerobolus stellatus SS14]